MSKENRDIKWKGKKYLEHVGEFQQVIRPSTQEEINRFRAIFDRYTDTSELPTGVYRAKILSDTGNTTEFSADNRDALWEELSAYLLTPEAKWVKFTLFQPSTSLSGVSEFTFENRNVSTQTFETDGTKFTRTVSVPLRAGESPPVFERPSLSKWLKELKADSSVPFPCEFGDNYYSEEELRERGIHDYEAFSKHFEETQDEERFRAAITDRNGAEIWFLVSDNETALQNQMLEQGEPKDGQQWHFSRINREIHPKEHPLEDFRMRIHSDATQALEVVEMAGPDSPIVAVLELGLRLATQVEGMKARARAPEALKNPNRKRPPKGRQKHEIKHK